MSLNSYCVYIHHNTVTNKSYIGITSQIPRFNRWRNGTGYIKNDYFNRAILKYGWDAFTTVLFEDNLTKDEANHLERQLILLFKTHEKDFGYNIGLGGDHAGRHSKETRDKIKANHADFSGKNHPRWGKKLSEETKQKISNAHKGKIYSQERCQQISEQTRGSKNPRAKTVLCLNNGMIFNTAKEAGIWCNHDFSGICKVCNGKQKTCGIDPITGERLRWQYIPKAGNKSELLEAYNER